MSTVTDVILICGTSTDEGQAAKFGEMLAKPSISGGPPLKQVNRFAGGSHAIQADVWMGAYNYLEDQAALDAFHALPWEEPDQVQLFMKYEYWDRFKVFIPGVRTPFFEAPDDAQRPEGLGPEGSQPMK